MPDSTNADWIAKGIAAATAGNRHLARLHFERASKGDPVDSLVWLWMAWVADTPEDAALHLKKLQTGRLAEAAAAGLRWFTTLSEIAHKASQTLTSELEHPGNPNHDVSATSSHQPIQSDDGTVLPEPVYGLNCPGCRGRLRIAGKILGPLHRCPACHAVFVAEMDPKNPKRMTRRLLSTQNHTEINQETGSSGESDRPKLLVIDSRATRRQLMLNVLTRAGYQTHAAVNSTEALSLAIQLTPRVILIDGNMPGLDALEICRALRNQPATRLQPIVMLSNRTNFFDQVQAKLAGCTVFISKPCEADLMLNEIQKLVQTTTMGVSDAADATGLPSRITMEPKPTISEQSISYKHDPLGLPSESIIILNSDPEASNLKKHKTLLEFSNAMQESIFG